MSIPTNTSDNKRIAKNTLLLYLRQIITMFVSLYAVRVILYVLGEEDYGIYNIVAGIVVLFTFVNGAMATSTQRFLNFYLGQGDNQKVNEVYSSSLFIHLIICIIFLILSETIGLWFVRNRLNIPIERHDVALIVYQLAIITTIFNIIRVPYNAVIIAYEKMNFFAYISILESLLKLVIVFLLKIIIFDKLILYSIFLLIITAIIFFIYKIYCNHFFSIARYRKVNDKSFIKQILTFSGWSIIGATSSMANTQGSNIVLNIYTNVRVNAAMGIANQVNSAVYSFVTNFQTAFNPQLVKNFAAGQKEEFYNLFKRASKFSYFLLYIIVLPLYLNTEIVLSVWLKEVPLYAVTFVRLILICSLVESLNGPLYMAIQANGNIKSYQIIIGIINILNIPIDILFFSYLGTNPAIILIVRILLNLCAFIFRLAITKKQLKISIYDYIKSIICPIILVSFLSAIFVYFIGELFTRISYFFVTCIISIIFNCLFIMMIGLTKSERSKLFEFLQKRITK